MGSSNINSRTMGPPLLVLDITILKHRAKITIKGMLHTEQLVLLLPLSKVSSELLLVLVHIFCNLCFTDPAAAPTDPTAYYPDFWNYASLYGEEAARAYYTTWSPPVGTQPPEGIVLPTAAAGAAGTATAPADGTAAANGEKAATDQSPEVFYSNYTTS